jgi:hypothetical protein
VTDPFFDHDKRDVYRLEVEYVAGSFAIARKSLESGGRQTSVRLRPTRILRGKAPRCQLREVMRESIASTAALSTSRGTAALSTRVTESQ